MLSKNFIQEQKKIIEKEIARLEEIIAKKSHYEDVGSTDEDKTYEFEVLEENLALIKNSKKDLKELKAALKRIEEKKYGVCLKCGSAIETGRLKVYPAAAFCVTHAKKA